MNLPVRRTIFALAVFSFLPILSACPKKDPPVIVDAAPPPPPPEPDTGPVDLAPLEEDAGVDADAEAGPKKFTGKYNPNLARMKQCCNALRAEAKRMGASPEAGMFMQAAATCDGLAAQATASGTAPELSAVRGLLAGRQMPPMCSGL